MNCSTKQKMLPMNYQYYVSAWIYKVLRDADSDFSNFLHEKGYGVYDSKLYKLFNFSQLDFGRPILHKREKLFEIKQNEISIKLSFDITDIATNFIKGLFSNQSFYIGSKNSGIDLTVSSIETIKEPEFSNSEQYHLVTPWVVSGRGEENKYAQYLSPEDIDFIPMATNHIVQKFNAISNNIKITLEEISLKILSNYKKNGFLIKENTPNETRVIGYLFDFELQAPITVHQMIWNAGVSEKSSSGFGWIERIKK